MRQTPGLQVIAVLAWINFFVMGWYSVENPEVQYMLYRLFIAFFIALVMLALIYVSADKTKENRDDTDFRSRR